MEAILCGWRKYLATHYQAVQANERVAWAHHASAQDRDPEEALAAD